LKTKFLVFADLHVDIMHDTVARMQIITRAAVDSGVDFLLHLGDIMYPDEDFLQKNAPDNLAGRGNATFLCDRDDEKRAIRAMLNATGLQTYGVLGNHDMDSCDKRAACLYWGMPGPYYAFVRGGVRFLALDANFIETEEGLVPYNNHNYKAYKRARTTFLPKEQLDWLEAEIMASPEPCVLLSHASLADDVLNVQNMRDVWAIIRRANADKRRVILALNGHNHVDGLTVRVGVPFVSINSVSNIWIGRDLATVRYSETITRTYPHIVGCAPYYHPLYTIMTIDDGGIGMTGAQSCFVGPTPAELGFNPAKSYHEPTPRIRARHLPLTAMEGDGRVEEADEEAQHA